jgi:hypothetical protein
MLKSLGSASPMGLATPGCQLPPRESVAGALQIPLRKRSGMVVAHTMVSEEDGHLAVFRWYRTGNGYAARCRNGTVLLMHRAIMNASRGVGVDHVNRDRLDNRRCNLRFASHFQQAYNSNISRKNTSGYKGVSFRKYDRRWVAEIRCGARDYFFGMYSSPEEAAIAYDLAALALHREFAATNFQYSDRARREAVGMAHLFPPGPGAHKGRTR